ncbi:MAG: ABC transporter permease, partial [Paramuribaculum sp.]|nr:ABC transporter permease [Paramuribaculum sp.]
MSKDMVWRLLRKNISVWQLGGYAAATFTGLAIVLCAVRFYCDVHSGSEGDDPYVTKDYLVISKTVNTLGTLMGGDNSFTPDEIAELENCGWVKRVGAFTSSDFNVSASLDMGGRGMSTSLFLESVPTDFFDVVPSGWRFDPLKDNTVPIVLNKDYLTLYN